MCQLGPEPSQGTGLCLLKLGVGHLHRPPSGTGRWAGERGHSSKFVRSAEHHASRVTSTGKKRIHTGCVTEVQGANYILWKCLCSIVFIFH